MFTRKKNNYRNAYKIEYFAIKFFLHEFCKIFILKYILEHKFNCYTTEAKYDLITNIIVLVSINK